MGPEKNFSRRRVFLLGTLLIIFNAWFGTYAYVITQALIWTQTSLLRGPLVMLFFLVMVNLVFALCSAAWTR